MTKARTPDPGVARREMATGVVDHDAIANPIWTAMERAIKASTRDDYAEINISQLLRSMRETHDSMRSILTGAEKTEKDRNQPTGRWADMLILSRAQLDATFIGLLLANDPERWGPKYYKCGWAAGARMLFYAMRRFSGLDSERAIHNRNVYCLKGRARTCKVTPREWIASLADVRGKALRFGATTADAIKPFPTPGEIAKTLCGGAYERLGQLLYQEWRFLCDPVHAGLSTLVLRHALRTEQIGELGNPKRDKMIQQEVLAPSIFPSFVAIMTLTTVLAAKHRDNADLRAKVVKGWEVLERGTREGGIIWDQWASRVLGVLRA